MSRSKYGVAKPQNVSVSYCRASLSATPRQKDVLSAIVKLTEPGHAPSLRELCSELAISSPNGIECHLKILKRKGLVAWEPGKSRTLRLVVKGISVEGTVS